VRPFDLTEFRDSGLLYVANRALHVYGIAIAANRAEDGHVESLVVVETEDPLGLTFPEDTENEARQRLFSWIARKLLRDGEVLWRPTTEEEPMTREQMTEKVETPDDATVRTETHVRTETPAGGPGDGGTDGGGSGDGGTDGGSDGGSSSE
jgi:hypothetical protein